MLRKTPLLRVCKVVFASAITIGLSSQAVAGGGTKEITHTHLSDVHGHIRSHDEDFSGIARLATSIKEYPILFKEINQ